MLFEMIFLAFLIAKLEGSKRSFTQLHIINDTHSFLIAREKEK